MSRTASHSEAGFLSRSWRDPAAWVRAADVLAVLIALSLPWSTSLVAIFVVAFLLCLIPAFDLKLFVQSLKRPAGLAPVALFALAAIGMLWASDISWAARAQGLGPVAKLLLIPAFIYQFQRSGRGLWVIGAFIASCSFVLALSWFLYFANFTWSYWPGVPVKNYIAQSQEFAFCIFALLGVAMVLLEERRAALAGWLAALTIVFIANFVFVTSSRTILICVPILLLVFAFRHYGRSGVLVGIAVAVAATAVAWVASPSLRTRVSYGFNEIKIYEEQHVYTSTGMRLEFWRKSIRFIENAPLFGHGTGTIKNLFEKDAIGQTGASAEIVNNPHNQTLNVAIQWGALGVIILYAMWIAHLMLFAARPGLAAWIGLATVVENIVSSLFNSHLFDFTEGWLYVLAVGVAGGIVLRGSGKSARWALR